MTMLSALISHLSNSNRRNNYPLDIGLLDCWTLEHVMCTTYVYHLNSISQIVSERSTKKGVDGAITHLRSVNNFCRTIFLMKGRFGQGHWQFQSVLNSVICAPEISLLILRKKTELVNICLLILFSTLHGTGC